MRSILFISFIAAALGLTYGASCKWKDSNEFIKQRLTQSCYLSKTEVRDGKTFYLCCEDQASIEPESNLIISNENNDGSEFYIASGSSSGSSSKSGSSSSSRSSSSSSNSRSSTSNSKSSPSNSRTSSVNSNKSPAKTNSSPVKSNPSPVRANPAPKSNPAKPSAPVAKPPAPVAKSPAPVAKPPAPVAKPPAPVAKPPAPVAKPPAPVAKPPAPVAKPPAPVAKPPAPVAKPPAPVAKPPAPVAKPPAPVAKPPAPVAKTNSQVSITLAQFQKAVQATYPKAKVTQSMVDAINANAEKYGGIKTKQELAMFIAQTAKESMGYKYNAEIGGSKKSYGQKDAATGQSYYGRGYIQLTHKNNYEKASKAIFGDDTLVKNPELVKQEDINWKVSLNFWKQNVHPNAAVQAGHFDKSTTLVNGPKSVTRDERFGIYQKVSEALGVDGKPIK